MKAMVEVINGVKACISKGRKRQYFCHKCGHHDIEPGDGYYTCNNCGNHAKWKSRASFVLCGTPLENVKVPSRLPSKEEATHLTYERNHEPDQQGIWFDYTGFRYKDYYDIELFNGEVIAECRPNGDGWYGYADSKRDHHVRRIRLKPDSELDPDWSFTGQERIDRNLKMFR